MFADHTLTPKEAVRLCALGIVAAQPIRYGALAGQVRHFTSRIVGPSLELMGTSIELLRYEGLVEAVEGAGMDDDALLTITAAGQSELQSLLTARLRPGNDITRLVVALKFRFLHLLSGPQKVAQIDMLLDMCETDLARLEDLRGHHGDGVGHLGTWLDHEIALLERHLRWLEAFRGQA